ncbi:unnamed protein product [Orchesella dallaii]|uniref:Uncharacterized protein n=1 Tax=Orchesella dallaii TaxID=48710 RepID=A0ABP1QCM0_9HEXA
MFQTRSTDQQHGVELLLRFKPTTHNHMNSLLHKPPITTFVLSEIHDINYKQIIYVNEIGAFAQIKILIVDTSSDVLLISCQLCNLNLQILTFQKRSSTKLSDGFWESAIPIRLIKVNSSLKVLELVHLWNKLNFDWGMGHSLESISGSDCDNYRGKLHSEWIRGVNDKPHYAEAEDCVLKTIHNFHNCSKADCFKPLKITRAGSVNQFSSISSMLSGHGFSILNFGTKLVGFKYVYFKARPRGKVNIEALLKPIPYTGWLLIFGVIVCMWLTFRMLKVPYAFFSIVASLLEQDFKIGKLLGFKKCFLVIIWLFTCVLVRNVYTSTMYTFLTTPTLQIPSSLEEIYNDTSVPLLFDDGSLAYVTIEKEIENHTTTTIYPFLKRRSLNAINCFTDQREYWSKSVIMHTTFLWNITHSIDISCRMFANDRLQTRTIRETFSEFAMIYNQAAALKTVFAVLSKRRMHVNIENAFSTRLFGIASLYKNAIQTYYEQDLGALNGGGILMKLQHEIQMFMEISALREDHTKLYRNKKKFSFYSAVQYFNNRRNAFSWEYDNGVVEPCSIQSVLAIWILHLLLLVICLIVFTNEILVSIY